MLLVELLLRFHMSSGVSGRKTPVLRLFGSQELRKHSCAEWSKEVSFADNSG